MHPPVLFVTPQHDISCGKADDAALGPTFICTTPHHPSDTTFTGAYSISLDGLINICKQTHMPPNSFGRRKLRL